MDVLWSVLAGRILVPAPIINVVPASFTFIGEQNIGSVIPSEPSPHLLREIPNLLVGLLVNPMCQGPVQIFGMSADLLWELSVKSGENVIERKGVSCKVYPARVSRKNSECLTWPQSIAFRPGCYIWVVLFCIRVQGVQVELPWKRARFCVEVLLENAIPLLAGDSGVQCFVNLVDVQLWEI